jgi:hypothetical protein
VLADDEIAESVDMDRLTGKDERRRIELCDDRRSFQALPGAKARACVDGHLPRALLEMEHLLANTRIGKGTSQR